MSLHSRICQLERTASRTAAALDNARQGFLRFLFNYRGSDPDLLYRRARLMELAGRIRERRARQGVGRPPR